MYGIYANIWGILMVNVAIYSIHGSYSMGYKSAINPVQSTSVKHVGEIRTVPWFSYGGRVPLRSAEAKRPPRVTLRSGKCKHPMDSTCNRPQAPERMGCDELELHDCFHGCFPEKKTFRTLCMIQRRWIFHIYVYLLKAMTPVMGD